MVHLPRVSRVCVVSVKGIQTDSFMGAAPQENHSRAACGVLEVWSCCPESPGAPLAVFSALQPGLFLIPLPGDGRRMTGSQEDLEEEALQECAEDPGAAVT